MYDIIIGREKGNIEKYGNKGTVNIGKHYVKMGQTTSLSNPILMDVASSHVVFICGKRGSGKSYSMGVIAESMVALPPEIAQNLSIIMLDTMGIYWTMKFPNQQDSELLGEWDMEPSAVNVQIFIPHGYFQEFKDRGIPTDFPFSINPTELQPEDWCMAFELDINEQVGVLITRIISDLKESEKEYSIQDIIQTIESDKDIDKNLKYAATNRFKTALSWGLFSDIATPIKDLISPGKISIVDVSCYATTSGRNYIRALVIGLIAEKLFVERMVARRAEECTAVKKATSPFSEQSTGSKLPLVWLFLDEAHEFLPREGKTISSEPLITILREGRQPGISLVLASQQPGKIHTDVMTQADTVIAHRITAKPDVEALGMLMQSYMRTSLDKYLNELPKVKGAAIIFDDTNERLYPMKIKPRISWHGGSAPFAIKEKKDILEEL